MNELGHEIFAIEEPATVNDLDSFRRIFEATGGRIILDESFLRQDQLPELAGGSDNWILNCRVSKLGGLIRSLDIVEQAKQLGLSVVVGAQVGETSLLTRAGLSLASAARPVLVGMEGAFGTYLLREDLADRPLMFSGNGVIEAGADFDPSAPGLGLALSEKILERWTQDRDVVAAGTEP
jgi:L-alanine-DL-glutamate epimerase-like enolase superfamily enzyme